MGNTNAQLEDHEGTTINNMHLPVQGSQYKQEYILTIWSSGTFLHEVRLQDREPRFLRFLRRNRGYHYRGRKKLRVPLFGRLLRQMMEL